MKKLNEFVLEKLKVTKAERNAEMDYGQILRSIPTTMGLQQPLTCKMVKVQRSSPSRRVELQANGRRKIRLLKSLLRMQI